MKLLVAPNLAGTSSGRKAAKRSFHEFPAVHDFSIWERTDVFPAPGVLQTARVLLSGPVSHPESLPTAKGHSFDAVYDILRPTKTGGSPAASVSENSRKPSMSGILDERHAGNMHFHVWKLVPRCSISGYLGFARLDGRISFARKGQVWLADLSCHESDVLQLAEFVGPFHVSAWLRALVSLRHRPVSCSLGMNPQMKESELQRYPPFPNCAKDRPGRS